jgi:uncharacterized protein involved in exopolysaccharide biosynthesis
MTQLNQALTERRTQRERVISRLEELRKIPADNPAALPAQELLASGTLAALRAHYVDDERTLKALQAEGRGENHPATRAAQAQLDSVRAALLSEVKNIQESYERDAKGFEHEIAGLRRLYDAAEKRALDLNLMEIEYGRLRRGKETNEKLFSLVIERSKETDLTRALRINNVRIVDRPLIPRSPVTPNVPLNIAGGVAAGLALGLLAAIGILLHRASKTGANGSRMLASCWGDLTRGSPLRLTLTKCRRASCPRSSPDFRDPGSRPGPRLYSRRWTFGPGSPLTGRGRSCR